MKKECIELIKEIGVYQLFIGGVVVLALIPLAGRGAGLFYLGIGCSFINFLINAFTNSKLNSIGNITYGVLFIIFYAIRVGFICVIAIYLMIKKEYFFYIFIAGYTAQLISFIIYGFRLKVKEGV